MAKVIKVNQKDIENIISMVLSEQMDDFDTKIQPEELPQDTEINPEDFEDETSDPNQGREVPRFLIGKDENGKISMVDTKTGKILRP